MNIVYLLTNLSKASGRRFYIGSKQECTVTDIRGVMTIIANKSKKPYYSSSQSLLMKEELLKGDIFEATVLEQVPKREDLLEREEFWIQKNFAVTSEDYYNISNAKLNCHDQDIIVNSYGETLKELAGRNSALSNKDNTAKAFGFNHMGDFIFYIWDESRDKAMNLLSQELGKSRHFCRRYTEKYNEGKAREDLLKPLQGEVRKHHLGGCSLHKISEILDIELPAARVFLGDYNRKTDKKRVPTLKGLSVEEFEVKLTSLILDGCTINEASNKMGINATTGMRYFLRYLRGKLKSSDL